MFQCFTHLEVNCLLEVTENMAQKDNNVFRNKRRHSIMISDILKAKDRKRRLEMVLVQC